MMLFIFRKQKFRKNQQKRLQQEAKDAVASKGRSKVTYNSDDLFGETYEEVDESSVGSRSSGNNPDIGSIQQTRKRGQALVGKS